MPKVDADVVVTAEAAGDQLDDALARSGALPRRQARHGVVDQVRRPVQRDIHARRGRPESPTSCATNGGAEAINRSPHASVKSPYVVASSGSSSGTKKRFRAERSVGFCSRSSPGWYSRVR